MKVLKQTLLYLLAFVLLTNVQLYSQSKKATGEIFSPEIKSSLTNKQLKYLNYEKSKKVELFKLVKTQSEIKNASSISLDIFGKEIIFDINETRTNRDNSISLVGFNEKYEFFMTIDGSDITANIIYGDKTYAIVPLGNKMHYLIEIDLLKYKHEEEPKMIESFKEDKNVLEKSLQILTSNSDVDILVAYTPAASSAVSNMSTLINNAISQINSSFIEGGVHVTYHLVHSTEINIVEGTKNSTEILDEFDSNPTIISLRNEYLADLCFLITNTDSVSGAAWQVSNPTPWTSFLGFAIGNYNFVRDYKTFSHETGHNFGALHNIEEDPSPGYKHGYLNTSADFCTIMSYPSTNFSQRKNIWSDPYNTYNGYSRGVVGTSENVRWLNEQRGDIENYRTFQTSGIISSDHHWRRDIVLTDNVYVDAVLTLESDCSVDLNGFFIKINSGSIIQESGSTISGLGAYLKYYSTLKGYFPTIQSAIDNAS